MNDRKSTSGSASSFNDFSSSVSDPLAGAGSDQDQPEQGKSQGSGGNASQTGKDAADAAKQKTSEVAGKAQEKMSDVSDKASDVAGKAQEKAGEASDKAKEKTDQGIDKAASGLGQAADMLRKQGEQRGGTVASAATMTAEKLDGAGQYLKDKDTDQLLSDLESLVRRKPVESLLVAAGAGFVLSKLFG